MDKAAAVNKKWCQENKAHRTEYKRRYRAENKEKEAAVSRKYYEENKDVIAEKSAKYRAENPDYFKAYMKEYCKIYITCECGCRVNKNHKSIHLKTAKHQKLLASLPKEEED